MKPFIKWVGGKTQIIEDVLGSFPTKIDNYHEVFVVVEAFFYRSCPKVS